MSRAVGVMAAEHIVAGVVEGSRVASPLCVFPEAGNDVDQLGLLPAHQITGAIADLVARVAAGHTVDAVGLGFPGVIRGGLVEESPNLQQAKGSDLRERLAEALAARSIAAPVHVINDADAVAAGIAAERGHLDKLIRVWTLGVGVGYGRYPQTEGMGEGGHMTVTLDPREAYCGCGGVGHLEGIMGHRAMRLRFLDLEPEEIFAEAAEGDARCREFVELWHRALAAATATLVHVDGPGRFFVAGPNARFVRLDVLGQYVSDMVRMSPLRGSSFEIVAAEDDVGVLGAAVSALHAAGLEA